MNLNKISLRITSVVDWFIPFAMKLDRDRLAQARIFLISHLFGPILGSAVPIALYLIDPTHGFEIAVLTVSILGFWVFPFLLKNFGRYNLLAVLSVENLIFCILWSCYFYGGVKSPTLPWVLTIPLLAFFYIGSSNVLRSMVIGLFIANIVAFLTLSVLLPPPKNDLPTSNVEWLGMISTIAVALYVSMMAIYYAKVYASQAELESEMREHLQSAAELRRLTAEAERSGAAKAEFLAKMSHELRTPLNAVINYSEILLEDSTEDGDEEIVSDLNKIHRAGRDLLKLINEVLDLSKIDAGMMGLYNEECNIGDIIQRVVDELKQEATESNNTVNIKIDQTLGTAYIDQQKVQQAVQQIVENALKFTSNGTVTISVARVTGHLKDMFSVAVRDTGVGISPDELPQLFEHFTVLGDFSSSKYGGTGLGLALSQRLCKLMGGDIKATSKLNEGSCFTITLPLRQVQDAPAKDLADSSNALVSRLREKLIAAQQNPASVAA